VATNLWPACWPQAETRAESAGIAWRTINRTRRRGFEAERKAGRPRAARKPAMTGMIYAKKQPQFRGQRPDFAPSSRL